MSFEFDYRVVEPEPPLGRLVESVWYARGTVPYTRERIAPTGSTVGILIFGDAIIETPEAGEALRSETGLLLGPHDKPVFNEPTGETFALGIVTTPVGCASVFGQPPTSLRGRVVDWLGCDPRAVALREQLLAVSDDPARMLELVVEALETREVPTSRAFERCERAVACLVAAPTRSIAEIADELGVSHAHLDRQFTEIVGLTPRVLARILRLRSLLATLDVNASVSWSALAAEYGWYDQAHFNRDFKRYTGVTPSDYVAAQREVYAPQQPGEGAGFVPEL